MKSYKFIFAVLCTLPLLTGCINELDLAPTDPNVIITEELSKQEDYQIRTLAKLYASFVVPGQDGTGGAGDLQGIDNGFGCYLRAYWNMQELSTDAAACAWNDQTIDQMHYQTWSVTDVFISAMYSRILYTATICSEFVRLNETSTDPAVIRMVAEAKFLRALTWYHAIDMFGNPAFVDEKSPIGKVNPPQISRAELFAYIESQVKGIIPQLGEPRWQQGRADKAGAWMLLANLYLNAEVFNGTAKYVECEAYCDSVINSGYTLQSNYRSNFMADNHTSNEIIFAFAHDGLNTQSYGGTGFITHACTSGTISTAEVGIGSGWGGNRTTKNFMNILVDTTTNTTAGRAADKKFATVKDTRVFLTAQKMWDMLVVASWDNGIGVRKFANTKADGTQAENYHNDYSSIDYPIYRLGETYVIRAEARLRQGKRAEALADVNFIRNRAFAPNSLTGAIDDLKLSLDFILDEKAREMYYEGARRTDLVRHNKFTTAAYLWQWKGGTLNGQETESYRNLFPIPSNEIVANPTMKQNPGY